MIFLTEKSKIKLRWKINPEMYSQEASNELKISFATKYNIPKENVKVVPEYILPNGKDETSLLTNITCDNIQQDPNFQKNLFKKYLFINNIEGYDWDIIESLDNEFNERINYSSYDGYRKFSIKWIRWSNFLSYGANNSFDFTNLKGLVLINGEPANMCGKTAFAVDLIHFLLFGKSSPTRKCDTYSDLFNINFPEITDVTVEGCINIDGQDYVIKRILTRPALNKRTEKSKVSQKVQYYRIVGNELENLDNYEEENGENPLQTNKIIKDCIGREEDFDLIMCVTGSNIDELSIKGPTERGKLFMRWIGLLPIEEKYEIANDKFKNDVKPRLLSNTYNREELKNDIVSIEKDIEEYKEKIGLVENDIKTVENEIKELEKEKDVALSQKNKIDKDVLSIDITTLEAKINEKVNEGKLKKSKISVIKKEIDEIGNIEFSVEEYNKANESYSDISSKQSVREEKIKSLKDIKARLEKAEYCPTCGQKLKNVDNSKQIEEKANEIDVLTKEWNVEKKNLNDLKDKLDSKKNELIKYNELNKKKNQKIALETQVGLLREEYIQLNNKKKEYLKNKEAIDENSKLDLKIGNLKSNIQSKTKQKEYSIATKSKYLESIEQCKKNIVENTKIIEKITKEEIYIRNYKLYLDMIGKNGISKIVLRQALPIINGKISQKLDGVCDFDISVELNNKNEVIFNIIKNGIARDVSSESGYERTVTALVLRNVLSEMAIVPKMNYIIFDEILGRVATENHDKIRVLYDKISKDYDFIFHITHNEMVNDWHNQIVTVNVNKDGCSELKQTVNVDLVPTRERNKKSRTKKK